MNARPYSVRDLRSVFQHPTLARDFFGEYEYTTRRWRFGSAEHARAAARFLGTTSIVTYDDRDACRHRDVMHRYGGVSVTARNWEGKGVRGLGFFVFPDADACFAAQRALWERTRAPQEMVVQLELALRIAAADDFPQPPAELLGQLQREGRPKRCEVEQLLARAAAVRASRACSFTRAHADWVAVVEDARRFAGEFEVIATPEQGRVVGRLVGRSAHHLAVQTEADGRGMVFERWRIAMPLREQYVAEIAFDRGSVIGIDLERGYGRALQLRKEDDFFFGSLAMHAALAARDRGLFPILQREEFMPGEDLDAEVVARDETLAAVLDDGAYAVVLPRSALSEDAIRIRCGPTVGALQTPSLSRRRR